jgi:hypothetical protein
MRRYIPLLTLAVLLALPPAAAPAATVGISDQQASAFSSPFYAPL